MTPTHEKLSVPSTWRNHSSRCGFKEVWIFIFTVCNSSCYVFYRCLSVHRGEVYTPLRQTPSSPEMATAADGTHPTEMHSCSFYYFITDNLLLPVLYFIPHTFQDNFIKISKFNKILKWKNSNKTRHHIHTSSHLVSASLHFCTNKLPIFGHCNVKTSGNAPLCDNVNSICLFKSFSSDRK